MDSISLPRYPAVMSVDQLAKRNRIDIRSPSAWHDFIATLVRLTAQGVARCVPTECGGILMPEFGLVAGAQS